MNSFMKPGIHAVGGVFILTFTTAAWAWSLTAAKPGEVGLSASRLEKNTQRLKQEINEGKSPGAVVMIARRDQLAYVEGFGFRNKDNGTTVPKGVIFRAHSVTKPLVEQLAVVMMTQAPGPSRAYYRQQVTELVYQATGD